MHSTFKIGEQIKRFNGEDRTLWLIENSYLDSEYKKIMYDLREVFSNDSKRIFEEDIKKELWIRI